MPLSTSQQSCHSVYLNLIAKLHAYLASGDNLRSLFNPWFLLSFAPHSPETQHLSKNPFLSVY